ncbi:uncharacterized protein LY89DRAFT_694338 [Mollisia scopiformis]|uniref:DUF676 domain-containing protein n=1 Tax=Mollisia scopiformis TaxID=149040 RepID=A0A194XNV1_MOLSC|nr:uncharacterized protein LY89DRAFT_694338 [Mollisia scopiformis]KUJ21853.1 hypothetical protein LY89DRAFT_694338 [Mollisia scopiformis]
MSQVHGIQQLYLPEGEPTIDIVAVHGLNGATQTFCLKYLTTARILTWGYNANVTDFSGTTSSDRILQHAHTLIAQLWADRELENAAERPIIFLCHSLGGIIVKRALAYSHSRTAHNIAHLHSIYTCTVAGSLFKLTAPIPKKILRSNSSLVHALEPESEILQNITDQFAPLMSKFHNTKRSGIAADHRGMCKFEDSTCQGFRTVVSALRRYSKEAPQVVKARTKKASIDMDSQRCDEAAELLRAVQYFPMGTFPLSAISSFRQDKALLLPLSCVVEPAE